VEEFQRYTTAREITSRLRYDRAETKTIELNMNKSAKRGPTRIARIRRRWRSLSFQVRLTVIVTVLLGIVAAVPSYIGLLATRSPEGSSSAVPPGSAPGAGLSGTTNTSLRQSSGQAAALRLDAAYIRTPESIMWAVPRALPPEDDPVILAPNLIGNEPAQGKISALLLKRGGVKIEADETEDFRPHSQIRLVITGQHERPVLVTGLRANVVRRERPLSQTLVYGPPQGAGENIQVGLDLDARTPSGRSFRDGRFLDEPYFAAHHVSVKPGEQVVFTVRAFTSKCYCEWELLVDSVVDGKDQVLSVKDGDQPFRTTAFAAVYQTIYNFDFFKGRFIKLPPRSKFPPPQSGP
jgi:hypothetical protein